MQAGPGQSEVARILGHINVLLAGDFGIHDRLPLREESFFEEAKDGILFCKLINILSPGLISERIINLELNDPKRRPFQMLENQSIALEAARRLGCSLVNVGPSDLVEGKRSFLLGLTWQILKHGTFAKNATKTIDLTKSNSDSNDTSHLQNSNDRRVENSLLQWVNGSLSAAGNCKTMNNFGEDLADGLIYGTLLAAIAPENCDLQEIRNQKDPSQRAALVVQAAKRLLGPQCILQSTDIIQKSEHFNILFLAMLHRYALEEVDITTQGESRSQSREQVEVGTIEDMQKLLAERDEKIRELMEENLLLRKYVFDKETVAEGMDLPVNPEESLEQVPSALQSPPSTPQQDILKVAPLHGHLSRSFLDDAIKLRQLYYHLKDVKLMVSYIFDDLSATTISNNSAKSGQLCRKNYQGNRWRCYYTVLRDNFLFFYQDKTSYEPINVERLDDCLWKWMRNVCGKIKDPILCIEVVSHVDPHYFYISSSESYLEEWCKAISLASNWWSRRQ